MTTLTKSLSSNKAKVRSPCIGVCSTGIGGSICRGCKRYMHEIVNWNAYSDEERQTVFERLDGFIEQIVCSKLQVVDAGLLEKFLKAQRIDYSNFASPYSWAFQLLKAGASQMRSWDCYGLRLNSEHINKSPVELREEIDREYYVLSCAHYNRYFEI